MRGWVISAGLGAVAIVTIIGILLAATNSTDHNSTIGVWLIALLPLGATIAGAIVLAGREAE